MIRIGSKIEFPSRLANWLPFKILLSLKILLHLQFNIDTINFRIVSNNTIGCVFTNLQHQSLVGFRDWIQIC